jgi:hypothetical protein
LDCDSIALILRLHFSRLHALNLLLITAFTVFIFKAGWFQAELLFYFLNFCLFVLLWRLLKQPSLPVALITGVLAGLAHLTKASIMPGLFILVGVMALQGAWEWLKERGKQFKATRGGGLKILTLTLVLLAFHNCLSYTSTSKRIFGHIFTT